MGLSDDRKFGMRQVLNTLDVNPEVESAGFRDDVIEAVWPEGDTLPTASAEKWPGRTFWHTVERTLYVCDDAGSWLPVGGQYAVALGTFGTVATGYAFDATGGASYVYRSGKRVDVRLRIRRTAGALVHGDPVFTTSAAYRPAGIGAWPFAAIQAGSESASSGVVAAVLNQSGTVVPLSPSGTHTVLELSGAFYLP